MTPALAGFLIITALMVLLFLTEKVSTDLAALSALLFFILFGYLTPEEAFSGFSSPVILTLIPMFMIGAGLRLSGVTELTAHFVARYLGTREVTCILVVMILGAVVSSFMNNVAATALLIPTVIGIGQRSRISPSRLLMPLSFAVMLGGMMTLIGTAPNILVSSLLSERTGQALHFFDFSPYALIILCVGIAYMLAIGRWLLPANDHLLSRSGTNLTALYHLQDHVFALRVPKQSKIDGETLANLHFGESLGINVVSIYHAGEKILRPGPENVVNAGDTLIVNGQKEDLLELVRFRGLQIEDFRLAQIEDNLLRKSIKIGSRHAGKTIRDLNLLTLYHLLVVAIERSGELLFEHIAQLQLQENDILHVVISNDSEIANVHSEFGGFEEGLLAEEQFNSVLESKLNLIRIPKQSRLEGITLKASKMSALTGLVVLAIIRRDSIIIVSDSEMSLHDGDKLIVLGEPAKLVYLSKLGELELLSNDSSFRMLETADSGLIEVILAPRSQLTSKTLSEVSFREKYDMNVLALWREGKVVLRNLKKTPFRFGDALLLHGLKSKMPVLAEDSDFVLLRESLPHDFRQNKRIFACISIILLLIISGIGFLSTETAAWIAAAVLMLSGTITMEEAYREVDWRIVILVSCLLPISIIFHKLGLTSAIAMHLGETLSGYNPIVILLAVSLLTSFVSQFLEGTLAVILFMPVAIGLAQTYNLDLKSTALVIAMSASNAFLTPISHRAHLLVMGAGAYRFADYFKVGLPFTILFQILLFILYLAN